MWFGSYRKYISSCSIRKLYFWCILYVIEWYANYYFNSYCLMRTNKPNRKKRFAKTKKCNLNYFHVSAVIPNANNMNQKVNETDWDILNLIVFIMRCHIFVVFVPCFLLLFLTQMIFWRLHNVTLWLSSIS